MDVVAWIKTIIFRSYEIQNQAELTYSNISQKSGSLGGGGASTEQGGPGGLSPRGLPKFSSGS